MVQFNRNFSPSDASGKTLSRQAAVKSKDPKDAELYKACMDFEAVMTKQMLAAMQGSTPLFGKGFGGEYFQEMFQDEMSKNIGVKGIGLGDMLYRQLAKSLPPVAPQSSGGLTADEPLPNEPSASTDSQIKTGE